MNRSRGVHQDQYITDQMVPSVRVGRPRLACPTRRETLSLQVSPKPTVLRRAVPEGRLCERRSAHPGQYDAHGQLSVRSRGRGVEFTRLLPDARAPVRLRQLSPLARRVPTPLLAPEPYHLHEQPRKFIHELLDLVLGHGPVRIYFVSENLVNLDDLGQGTLREWTRMSTAPTEAEVEPAKSQLKATLLLGLGDTSAIAEDIGRQVVMSGRRFTPKQIENAAEA